MALWSHILSLSGGGGGSPSLGGAYNDVQLLGD